MKTIFFNDTYINDYYVLIGKDEKKHIKKYNYLLNDYYFNEKSFEQAEIKMQRHVIENLINNNHLSDRDINVLLGGDLSNQITASTYAAKIFNIPFLGVYGACSTFIEELIISSILLKTIDFNQIICCTSSNALTAERQFRYPIEYGYSRPMTSTVTATGAVSALVNHQKSNIKIISGTIGKIIDMGINDVNHMGAVMSPACANTLFHHLKNSNKKLLDYDLILTGDLGTTGIKILKEYYLKTYHEEINNIQDAGSILFNGIKNKYSGGSGPCCLPLVFFGNILPQKKHHRILLLGTGAMHSATLVNQKLPIPAICHAIELEV